MLKLLLGDPNARKLKRYQPIVSDINLLEEEIAPLSDDQLREKTTSFQHRLANAGSLANQRPLFVKPASGCWACATSMCN
jgi:preprotein translocase subunit SecA